jgi:hypothetical protein
VISIRSGDDSRPEPGTARGRLPTVLGHEGRRNAWVIGHSPC